MTEFLEKSKSRVGVFYGKVEFTGSAQIRLGLQREPKHVDISLIASTGADAAKAVSFSWEKDADLDDAVNIYAWKENLGTDRVAATSAVTVSIVVHAE